MNIMERQVFFVQHVKHILCPPKHFRKFLNLSVQPKFLHKYPLNYAGPSSFQGWRRYFTTAATLLNNSKLNQSQVIFKTNNLSKENLHHDSIKRSSQFIVPESPPESLSVKIVNACPDAVKPYLKLMRMDRPIGSWLVFLPCAWSISLATPSGQLPDPKILLLFGMGSFLMRGAGCVINDMWDKDFDAKVARTRNRPLACGEVTRFKALCFLSLPLSLSLSILLTFNWNTILLGVCSLGPCIAYPLAKRFTYWPQAFLGITQGWGILIAWSETHGALSWPTLSLFASGIFWTMTYDTIYSYQDIEDDLRIGVKSTAIKFGENTKYWLAGFGSCTTGGLLATGFLCDQTLLYFGGVTAFAAHLAHQIWSVNLKDGEDCGRKFRSNRNLGLLLWMVIVASNLLKKDNKKDEDKEGDAVEHF